MLPSMKKGEFGMRSRVTFLLLAIFIYNVNFCLQESKAWWKLDKVNIRNVLGVEKEEGKLQY